MIIEARTMLWVVGRDGTSHMSMQSIGDAFRGGMDARDVMVTTTKEEADALTEERRACLRIERRLSKMSVEELHRLDELIAKGLEIVNADPA